MTLEHGQRYDQEHTPCGVFFTDIVFIPSGCAVPPALPPQPPIVSFNAPFSRSALFCSLVRLYSAAAVYVLVFVFIFLPVLTSLASDDRSTHNMFRSFDGSSHRPSRTVMHVPSAKPGVGGASAKPVICRQSVKPF